MKPIRTELLQPCIRILEVVLDKGRFTKREFSLIEKAKRWLSEPHEDFRFSFQITITNNGESTYYEISFDGWQFELSEIHRAYDDNVGGDTSTSFEYLLSPDRNELTGDIDAFENNVMQVINFLDSEEPKVKILISEE